MIKRKGTYVLFLTFDTQRTISVGALGEISLRPGMYCYVGSAMNGLDQRVGRHIAREKKLKWHIDYLTTSADLVEAAESYPDYVPECVLAEIASESGCEPAVKGFGCSDCKCYTHLFWVPPGSRQRLIDRANLKLWHVNSATH